MIVVEPFNMVAEKMLGCRNDALIIRIRSGLNVSDEGISNPRGQHWIFTVSLLSTAPPWVQEEIVVRGHERQPTKLAAAESLRIDIGLRAGVNMAYPYEVQWKISYEHGRSTR